MPRLTSGEVVGIISRFGFWSSAGRPPQSCGLRWPATILDLEGVPAMNVRTTCLSFFAAAGFAVAGGRKPSLAKTMVVILVLCAGTIAAQGQSYSTLASFDATNGASPSA